MKSDMHNRLWIVSMLWTTPFCSQTCMQLIGIVFYTCRENDVFGMSTDWIGEEEEDLSVRARKVVLSAALCLNHRLA